MSIILGLIISFPILFQSFHAFEHHILIDHIHCCEHHEDDENSNNDLTFGSELDLCPVLEYQMVYFLSEKTDLPETDIILLDEQKSTILHQDIDEFYLGNNFQRGPPLV